MKAEDMLQRAEDYYQRKQGRTPIGTAARGATQMAEDARVLTLRKKEQEREEAARRAAADAQAKAQADAEAAQRDAEAAQAQANEDARRRAEAEAARAKAEQQQAALRAQRQQALAQAESAREAAEDAQRKMQEAQNQLADAERQRQEAEYQTRQAEQEKNDALRQKEEMRARLVAQLNQVLQTRDTARGLIVSMPDVLFAFNKYNLKPEAREKLAKISGIVLAYPDLKLDVEGHTDSIGSDEYNQKLSEERASTVRGYLISQGLKPDNISSVGLGKANPVADNSTSQGRQLNRRVEMVVSGDIIGTQIGSPSITLEPTAQNR
jgi:outer membrane protein OmpA-like peptidoglycan-associated protein